MKLPVLKPSALLAMVLSLAVGLLGSVKTRGQGSSPADQTASTPAPLGSTDAASPTPDASKKPAGNANGKPAKAGKGNASTQKASKEIPIILPIGEIIRNIVIPQNSDTGTELSKLFAMKMKRLDDDHMEMEGTKMNLKPDGKMNLYIEVPTSVFNLKTRVVHSEYPVVIRTDDFELSGEKMEFDTVNGIGKLLGRVEMHIHNLKQVATGQPDENANE